MAQDPGAILSGPEIRLLDREVRPAQVSSFPGIEAYLADSEDSIRWHGLGEQCRQARGGRGIRMSVALGVHQYRLRAIEGGVLREVHAELAGRYFRFLGIGAWVADWCRANRELATGVVDMRHYLDEGIGDLPEGIPERVLSLAVFFGAVVAWVTDHLPEDDWLTNVPCRRRPGRRRCRGEIVAELDRTSGQIVWHCPLCADNGLIHGWEDTPWDRQHDAGAAPTSASPSTTTH